MSTILDALRRAEAERAPSQDPLQALHAPPITPRAAPRPRRLRWLALAAVVGGAGLAAGLWLGGRPTPPPAVGVAPAPPPPAPARVAQAPVTIAPAGPAAPPPQLLEEPAPPARAEAGASAARAPALASASAAATAAPAALASAPAPRIPRLAELPAALRAQLPALQINGSMYSPDPRVRSLIVNGQLLREGDELAPGLRLERIDARSAVLRWREQAFELPY